MLGGVGDNAIASNISHLDETRCTRHRSEDTLVVTLEDQGDSSEDIEEDQESRSWQVTPDLDAHGDGVVTSDLLSGSVSEALRMVYRGCPRYGEDKRTMLVEGGVDAGELIDIWGAASLNLILAFDIKFVRHRIVPHGEAVCTKNLGRALEASFQVMESFH